MGAGAATRRKKKHPSEKAGLVPWTSWMAQSRTAEKKTGTSGMRSGKGRRTRSLSQPGTGSVSGGPLQPGLKEAGTLVPDRVLRVRHDSLLIATAGLNRQKQFYWFDTALQLVVRRESWQEYHTRTCRPTGKSEE